MYRTIALGFVLLITSLSLFAMEPVFARDPAISADGSEVCFVYDDDLWIVSFKGGNARRLTFTEGAEWGPAWSPDGSFIAFNSNREGSTYPYIMPAAGGEARVIIRETYSISDWFKDSQHLLGVRHNPRFGSSFYKIPIDGSRPVLLAEIGDRFASLSPDNTKIIFNRYGDPFREAYRGSLNGELWQIDLDTKIYSQLTNTDFTERYPKHSHINDAVYYCASDGERFQLYRSNGMNFSRPLKLTNFPQWSARDINIARKSDRIVFELFDEIWKYDPTRLLGEKVTKLEIHIPEDHWPDTRRFDTLKNDFYA
ncbi:MAG: DPP IV N-terminal domain-containing protein, partial [Candidatus Cloacimonadaceae bacterium]|nr:DPP IV N-terminal domain-containing protein [Candidatus Cloacimonadaceae bacterium]